MPGPVLPGSRALPCLRCSSPARRELVTSVLPDCNAASCWCQDLPLALPRPALHFHRAPACSTHALVHCSTGHHKLEVAATAPAPAPAPGILRRLPSMPHLPLPPSTAPRRMASPTSPTITARAGTTTTGATVTRESKAITVVRLLPLHASTSQSEVLYMMNGSLLTPLVLSIPPACWLDQLAFIC